jgi:hypothetical protein
MIAVATEPHGAAPPIAMSVANIGVMPAPCATCSA